MTLTLYQIDAFTRKVFGGNPAAVIPLTKWLDTELLQKIAAENNLSETAYLVKCEGGYDIRWFTPAVEMNLCGHATLASAYVLYEFLHYPEDSIHFFSKSGELVTSVQDELLVMNFPSWKPKLLSAIPPLLSEGLQAIDIVAVSENRDLLVELKSESAVKKIQPDFRKLFELGKNVIVTAPGRDCDFVSRFFGPASGIDEDPVTGSAHSQLIPYWSEKLNKDRMFARQLSARGGELWCEQIDDRVKMGGHCAFYMKGEIHLSNNIKQFVNKQGTSFFT